MHYWKRMATATLLLVLLAKLGNTAETWNEVGSYPFTQWKGAALGVHYAIPQGANTHSPILIVIPGARRDAMEYRDQWLSLARENSFIVLAIEATEDLFPSEYDYNAGGVLSEQRELQTEDKWLFSAIDLVFDDFVVRFGSTCKKYSIYGHSAGGGFVHRLVLLKPGAKFSRAVAANPAFVTMPDWESDYPFGLRGLPITETDLARWTQAPLTLMLGSLDLEPRTRPLSNGPKARQQGPHVFARGTRLFNAISQCATKHGTPSSWSLEIVEDVGHSNVSMAPHAVKYLFPKPKPSPLGPR